MLWVEVSNNSIKEALVLMFSQSRRYLVVIFEISSVAHIHYLYILYCACICQYGIGGCNEMINVQCNGGNPNQISIIEL